MSDRARASPELLEEARQLELRSDFVGVVELLDDVDITQLTGEPEVGYRLAYARRRVGRAPEALELVRLLDVPIRRRSDESLGRRRLNLEAMLCLDTGDIRAADELWQRLVERASAAGDPFLLAAAHNNLGIVQILQDRSEEALASYSRARLAYQQQGDRRGLAQAHQNLAILYREQGLLEEADGHFRKAWQHARFTGSDDVLGRAEEERALLFLGRGDARLARVAASRALRRLAALGDIPGEGEALRVLGIVALRDGLLVDARTHLEAALDRSRRARNALLRAETLEAMGVLEERSGNTTAAADRRTEAAELFRGMGAERWGLRIRRSTARLAGLA